MGEALDSGAALEFLSQSQPDLLLRLSASGIFLDARPGAELDFVAPPESFLGKGIDSVLPPDTAARARELIGQTLEDGSVHVLAYELDTPAGHGHFEARFIPGGADDVIVTVRDLTERHRVQAALAMQSAVAENIAEGAWLSRRSDGEIVWANRRAHEMLGCDDHSLVSRHCRDFVAEYDDLLPGIGESLRTAELWRGDMALNRQHAGVRWCETTISEFDHFEYGRVQLWLHNDVSERRAVGAVDETLGNVRALLAASGVDLKELTTTLARSVSDVVGATCVVGVIDENESFITPSAIHRADSVSKVGVELGRPIPLEPDTPLGLGGATRFTVEAGTPDDGLACYRASFPRDDDHDEQVEPAPRERAKQDAQQWVSVAPVSVHGRVIAILTAIRPPGAARFDDHDRRFLSGVARRAGPSILAAQLQGQLSEDAALIGNSEAGIFRTDAELTVRRWSKGAEVVTGHAAEDVLGRALWSIGNPGTQVADPVTWGGFASAQDSVHHEVEQVRPDGTPYWLSIAVAAIRGSDGSLVGAAGSLLDVTARRGGQTARQDRGELDNLTKLPTRSDFSELVTRALARYRRYGIHGALLCLDIDDFNLINSELGQAVGDQILSQVGSRIRAAETSREISGRLGGDEFGVLIEPVNPGGEGPTLTAERMLAALAGPYSVGGQQLHLNVSCGIARFPDDARTVDHLLGRANAAMTAAKGRGGGHAERFRRPDAEPGTVHPLDHLRRAVRNREFTLRYQPIVNMVDSSLVGFEALARWEHGDGSLTSPGSFLPLAEETGLIIPLGYQLFDDACAVAAGWTGPGGPSRPLTVSVNLSRRQFAADDLPARLQRSIERHGLRPSQLVVEITETTAFDVVDQAIHILGQLRDMGIQVALDDFGSGYSSLGALGDLAVDTLKIDQGLVRHLDHTDPTERSKHEALVTAAVRMGHSMGLTIVAEGVETQRQHDFLLDTGCDRGQGFHYADPRPASMALASALAIR